jgi:hypothetical protein
VDNSLYSIKLTNSNKVAIVDINGYDKCFNFKWRLNRKGYAKCNGIGLMHRFITDAPKDKTVHHKDKNKLNNTSDNLQILTVEEHKKIHKKSLTS